MEDATPETEGRGRNGNRNRGRRLTEPSAPLTEGKRKAARARQRLTARDRARAGSRARDPEQRRPHSGRKREGRVGREPGGGRRGGPWSRGNPATRVGPRPRAHAPEWLRPGAQAGEASGRREPGSERASQPASVRARTGARAPSASQPSGGGRACAGRGLLPRPWHVHRLLPRPLPLGGWAAELQHPRATAGTRVPAGQRARAGLGLRSTPALGSLRARG